MCSVGVSSEQQKALPNKMHEKGTTGKGANKEAELQATVWRLQQKNGILEGALRETLVRSATMEEDNASLREFVGSLMARVTNIESKIAQATPNSVSPARVSGGTPLAPGHPMRERVAGGGAQQAGGRKGCGRASQMRR
jgi:hypothetical protein